MATMRISNEELTELAGANALHLPKYVPQIINLANQNAQGTRPRVVGQLSELFPEFLEETSDPTIEKWEKWYRDKYPDAINTATEKIKNQVMNLKNAIKNITDEDIENWVENLIIAKTYTGLYYQKAIIEKIANSKGLQWRLADKYEEAKGIDGFIGDEPVSIKPDTYGSKNMLSEVIAVKIITYTKKKTGITVNHPF